MLKITDGIREAARRLLAKHNDAEPHRAEERFRNRLAFLKSWHPDAVFNEARVREGTVREAYADRDLRRLLEAIADGRRKLIDARWWQDIHGTVSGDSKLLAKMAALADPARNPSEHERKVAASKLAAAKARRPPGIPPPPPPLPKDIGEWLRKRKVKTPVKHPPQQTSLKRTLPDSVTPPTAPRAPVPPPL